MSEKSGVELIAEERQRQVEQEGWTAEHDDEHAEGDLVYAAVAYALPAETEALFSPTMRMDIWPWAQIAFKPTTQLRDLVKAGALIAAEIDRLQRKEARAEVERVQESMRAAEKGGETPPLPISPAQDLANRGDFEWG